MPLLCPHLLVPSLRWYVLSVRVIGSSPYSCKAFLHSECSPSATSAAIKPCASGYFSIRISRPCLRSLAGCTPSCPFTFQPARYTSTSYARNYYYYYLSSNSRFLCTSTLLNSLMSLWTGACCIHAYGRLQSTGLVTHALSFGAAEILLYLHCALL
jgi:hypothetical protein